MITSRTKVVIIRFSAACIVAGGLIGCDMGPGPVTDVAPPVAKEKEDPSAPPKPGRQPTKSIKNRPVPAEAAPTP